MQNDYIQHYGIKGMRWGIRRTPAQLGHPQKGFVSKDSPRRNKWEKVDGPINTSTYREKWEKTVKVDGPMKPPKRSKFDGTRYAKEKISDMSDQELQQRINRMQKEQQYKNMTKSPYRKIGETVVTGIVIAAGTELAKEYAKKYMRQGLEAVINASQ